MRRLMISIEPELHELDAKSMPESVTVYRKRPGSG